MANVLVQDTALTAIADAIRAKNGTEDAYKPAEMAEAIAAIETGGGSFKQKYAKLYFTSNTTTIDLSSIVSDYSKIDLLLMKSSGNVSYLYTPQLATTWNDGETVVDNHLRLLCLSPYNSSNFMTARNFDTFAVVYNTVNNYYAYLDKDVFLNSQPFKILVNGSSASYIPSGSNVIILYHE